MNNKLVELNESQLQKINGGGDADYGGVLAGFGVAAVGGAFVLTAGVGFLVALAVVGAAAAVQGAYYSYKA